MTAGYERGSRYSVCRWAFVLALFPTMIGAGAGPVQGQAVQGRLIDDGTLDPIVNANVFLLSGQEGEEVVRRTLTDGDGWFHMDARVGRFRLKAERIGYQAVTSPPFDLVGEDSLEVELRAAVEAVPLAPLTVISERAPLVLTLRLETVGYLERKNTWGREGLGLGQFIERSQWERRSPSQVSDIFKDVAGVRVVGDGFRNQQIRMKRITGFSPGGCTPMIYLDGVPIRFDSGDSIDDFISPWSLTAIEVYPGISKPGQFMGMGSDACGAIALWTG